MHGYANIENTILTATKIQLEFVKMYRGKKSIKDPNSN